MEIIGQISVGEISRKYNLGIQYAQNVADKLEEIGYIRKKGEYIYEIVQTNSAIDDYIKSHLPELRPTEYDKFGIKNNGKHTLKSTLEFTFSYYSLIIPAYIKKIIFTIPGFMLFLLWMIILKTVTTDGRPLSFGEYICICLVTYILPGIPINIAVRIIEADIFKIKFRNFMLLPHNWFSIRCKNAKEIYQLLHPNKTKIFVSFNNVLKELEFVLKQKKEYAEHYAQIANTASSEAEFYQSINSCLATLEWMSQFEKYGVFPKNNMPSDDIEKIKNNMSLSIERLRKRLSDECVDPSPTLNYDAMDGHAFEHFCADILSKNGFTNIEVTPGSGDQGIDIIAIKDSVKYGIQCKCYSADISNKAVQEAFSGAKFYDCHVPVVLTNRYFTKSAKELAEKTGVLLWNRDKLNEMIEKASLK